MYFDHPPFLASALLHLFNPIKIRVNKFTIDEIIDAYNSDKLYESFIKDLDAKFPVCYAQLVKPLSLQSKEDKTWHVSFPEQIAYYFVWKECNGISEDMLSQAYDWLKENGSTICFNRTMTLDEEKDFVLYAEIHEGITVEHSFDEDEDVVLLLQELHYGELIKTCSKAEAKKLGISLPQLKLLKQVMIAGISSFTLGYVGGNDGYPPRNWVTDVKNIQLYPKRKTLEILATKGYFKSNDNKFSVTEKVKDIDFICSFS
ncbi:hypothetical protein H4J59_08250 [Colwellia sp. MB02u-10]|uniref:hypothetical protein n=1 Tax=Colwellia sp. MB02u-10 TaxID=2759828 RepID=UPI0015F424B7|nr:hypothetical protein [Colwellia sp. MB02u-10]MBA6340978.1 hypothetical protein [Colwellia sp. MB02u-10]